MSTKLVACTLVVLIVGTIGISASIRQLVGSYLLEKTDSQITSQRNIVLTGTLLRDSGLRNNGLNTYFLQVRPVKNGKLTGQVDTLLYPVLDGNVVSIPRLPSNSQIDVDSLGQPFTTSGVSTTVEQMEAAVATNGSSSSTDGSDGSGGSDSSGGADAGGAGQDGVGDPGAGQPDIVSSPSRKTLDQASAPWRVAAFQRQSADKTVTAIVFIGLSLADQIDIIDTLTKYCVTVGIAIVLLGGSLAALTIQRTLDPLKRIEKTAAKIAAGDLTQRVPWAPENTEIGSLAVSLNTMLARIEKSFHEQEQTTAKMKRFVSDASHEA